jgi:hypothetical protein
MSKTTSLIMLGAASVVVILLIGVGGFLYYVFNHPSVQTAQEFLKTNQRLAQEIGAVKEINASPKKLTYTNAIVNFEATGDKKTVNGFVTLMYRDKWEVTTAHFNDEKLHLVDLLK